MKHDLIYEEYKMYEIDIPFSKVFDNEFKLLGESFTHRFKFDNNYGASVIKHIGSYGYEKDLFELAVIHFDENGESELCYETQITDDILGCLSNDEVLDILGKIKKLGGM